MNETEALNISNDKVYDLRVSHDNLVIRNPSSKLVSFSTFSRDKDYKKESVIFSTTLVFETEISYEDFKRDYRTVPRKD